MDAKLEKAIDRIFELTNGTEFTVEIWKSAISLKKRYYEKGNNHPGPNFSREIDEMRKVTPCIERNNGNIEKLGNAKSLKDIFEMFDYITGAELQNLRKESGLTRDEFADKLGVSGDTLGSYECNRRQIPAERAIRAKEIIEAVKNI